MHEQDLDQLIDSAAAEVVRSEPSDALTASVMDRVNHDAPASGRPRVVWAGLAASAALAILVVAFSLHRTPSSRLQGTSPSVAVQHAPAQPAAQPAPAFTQNFVFERVPQPQTLSTANIPASAVGVPGEQDAPVPPITIDPLSAPSPIHVPSIEGASTPIEEIDIEPLHIEPLSASND